MIESPGWVEWENDDITQRFRQAADNGHHVDTKADPPTTQPIQYMYMYQNNNSCSNHSLWWINNLPPKSYFISYKWTLYTILRRSLLFFILSSAYGFYFKKCTSFLQNLIVLIPGHFRSQCGKKNKLCCFWNCRSRHKFMFQ